MEEMGLVILALVLAALWSIACRVRVMFIGRTKFVVFAQHLVLALGLGWAAAASLLDWQLMRSYGAKGLAVDVLATPGIGTAGLVVAVLAFLLMSAHRWRFKAPRGTDRSAVRNGDEE